MISVVLFNYFPDRTASDTVRVRFRLSGDLCHHAGHFHSDRYACIKIKKENAKLSARDAFRTKILFNTSQLLQKAEDASEIFDITATKLVKLLGRDLTAAPAGAQESRIVRGTLYSAQTGRKDGKKSFDPREQEIIQWVLDSRKKRRKMSGSRWRTTAPGFQKESREHVFEMFYSGKNKVSDSRRSLGLGLALCRSIVNAHGRGDSTL